MRLYAMNGMGGMGFPGASKATLTVNTASTLIARLADKCESDSALAEKMAKQIYTLCLLSQRRLETDELLGLLDDSFGLLELL